MTEPTPQIDECKKDLQTIKKLAAAGELDDSLDNMMTEAWYFGWSAGFAFQGKLAAEIERRGKGSDQK